MSIRCDINVNLHSSLSWISPEHSGAFSIGVTGKITCGSGGGGGAPIDISAMWSGEVTPKEWKAEPAITGGEVTKRWDIVSTDPSAVYAPHNDVFRCFQNHIDAWGHSYINFYGWNMIKFPLPSNYPGEGYHWPYTSQWRCVKADGSRGDYVVHYPLKFKQLAVTSRSKVLHGTKVLSVERPEIYLKNLAVVYGDADKVF